MRLARARSSIGCRAVGLSGLVLACNSQTLDAGYMLDAGATADAGSMPDAAADAPHGLLPVDERNPVIVSNDGTGNWQGLYSVLFPSAGGPSLAGIAVNASSYATDLTANLADWQELVDAARASGLSGIPEPIASESEPLTRPADGDIDATTPNDSDGARLILDVSSRLSAPDRPVVVVVGGRLTDVADAYLLDSTVADRVVVVAALGSGSARGGTMAAPNGELDPWANWIVAQRFRYIQVSAFYDSTTDLPSAKLAGLPKNPLCNLVAAQQPNITTVATRTDQISVLAAGLPEFVVTVANVAPDLASPFVDDAGPKLVPSAEEGRAWLVTKVDATAAAARLQQMLEDTSTFDP